ncbi:MAG: hypothetical protein V1816_18315 [Pseudomonadota bacterium]
MKKKKNGKIWRFFSQARGFKFSSSFILAEYQYVMAGSNGWKFMAAATII